MAYEAARILLRLGADVRVFDPRGLPMKDGVSEMNAKVLELRALSEWSVSCSFCSRSSFCLSERSSLLTA